MINKKLLLVYLLVLAATFVVIGCEKKGEKSEDASTKEEAFNPESARAAIDASNALFSKAMMSGDSIALLSRYDDNSKVFPPNMEPAVGKAEIAKFMSGPMKAKMADFKIEAVSLSGTEDNLVEIGKYSIGDGKGNNIDKGKFVCAWKKVEDSWIIGVEIWNSDLPLPPASPPAMKK
jgi:ketosteroid isomerase-like protein